jgi:hypothetical protein
MARRPVDPSRPVVRPDCSPKLLMSHMSQQCDRGAIGGEGLVLCATSAQPHVGARSGLAHTPFPPSHRSPNYLHTSHTGPTLPGGSAAGTLGLLAGVRRPAHSKAPPSTGRERRGPAGREGIARRSCGRPCGHQCHSPRTLPWCYAAGALQLPPAIARAASLWRRQARGDRFGAHSCNKAGVGAVNAW